MGRELINGVSKHAKAAQAQFLFIDSIYKKIPTKKTRGTATLKKLTITLQGGKFFLS